MNGIKINDEALLVKALRAGLRVEQYVLERVVLDAEGRPRVEVASEYELFVEKRECDGKPQYAYALKQRA